MAIDSLDGIDTALETIKQDTAEFFESIVSTVLAEVKNKAKEELDGIVSAGLQKINDVDLKQSLTTFYNTEIAKIDAIETIDEASEVVGEVMEDTKNYILELVASQIAELRATVKNYVSQINNAISVSPYSFIPEAMQKGYATNLVNKSDVTYDFTNFKNVSNIKYGGFGEQWHMFLDNISKTELFNTYLDKGNAILSASFTVINDYLDSKYADTMKKTTLQFLYLLKTTCLRITLHIKRV